MTASRKNLLYGSEKISLGFYGIFVTLFAEFTLVNCDSESVVVEFSDNQLISWIWWDFWFSKLIRNLFAYATFVVPIGVFIVVVKKKHLFEDVKNKNLVAKIVKFFVYGDNLTLPSSTDVKISTSNKTSDWLRSKLGEFWLLIFCSSGLLTNYLLWGWLQEKLMTTSYWVPTADGNGRKLQKFQDAQFLVFANRITAFFIALIYVVLVKQTNFNQMPFYKYFYASFSNIISSWCQYEALHFISFPTQTLGKASKIIPVMIMGKFVERKTYPWHQYLTGFLISFGVCLFFLSREPNASTSKRFASETTWSGLVLMVGYLVFDSFTNNWQGALFNQYRMSAVQMMCGINFFSSILTFGALLEQQQLFDCLSFVYSSREVFVDILLVSLTSAVGQMFIFYTIAQFGAVTFTIIMTIRQVLAILLSCLYYGHKIYFEGVIGIVIVFSSLFMRFYFNKRFSLKG